MKGPAPQESHHSAECQALFSEAKKKKKSKKSKKSKKGKRDRSSGSSSSSTSHAKHKKSKKRRPSTSSSDGGTAAAGRYYSGKYYKASKLPAFCTTFGGLPILAAMEALHIIDAATCPVKDIRDSVFFLIQHHHLQLSY
jgi:hypothetical protein